MGEEICHFQLIQASMLVRIVKDWQYPETFFSQTPKNSQRWGDIEFTEEKVSACDYLIVLQRPPYDIEVTCPSGNVWLISQEPPVDYFKFFTRSFRYFDKVFSYYDYPNHPFIKKMQPVLPWHVFKTYDELISISKDHLSSKTNDVAWVVSNKNGFPGQKARMQLRKYLQQSSFNFNLFGRGFTPIHDKFDALFPVKYALAIENYSTDHYWTEKIADSFLSWSLPFYWGAPNLEAYFPRESFIRVDVNNPQETLDIIIKSIQDNEWEKRLSAIEHARNLVLNNYQFFPFIERMIRGDIEAHSEKQLKKYFIPSNSYPWHYSIKNQVKYYLKRLIPSQVF